MADIETLVKRLRKYPKRLIAAYTLDGDFASACEEAATWIEQIVKSRQIPAISSIDLDALKSVQEYCKRYRAAHKDCSTYEKDCELERRGVCVGCPCYWELDRDFSADGRMFDDLASE